MATSNHCQRRGQQISGDIEGKNQQTPEDEQAAKDQTPRFR